MRIFATAQMKGWQAIYKVLRSVIFSTVLAVVGLYLLLYILISLPIVQGYIKDRVEKEASEFFKGDVKIDRLGIHPFSEVFFEGVEIREKGKPVCLRIDEIGAGISLWRLVTYGRIEVTFGQIIGLNARITQETEGAPLNISFIIDAFKKKDPDRKPAVFDIAVKNIVIRKSTVSFSRLWKEKKNNGVFDADHFRVSNLRADVSLPKISNNRYIVDLRRLSFESGENFKVEALKGFFDISDKGLSVRNLSLDMPGTHISPSDLNMKYSGFKDIIAALSRDTYHIELKGAVITPSDFSFFMPALGKIDRQLTLYLNLFGNAEKADVAAMELSDKSAGLRILFKGYVSMADKALENVEIDELSVDANGARIASVAGGFIKMNEKQIAVLQAMGGLKAYIKGRWSRKEKRGEADIEISSKVGDIYLKSDIEGDITADFLASGMLDATDFSLGELLRQERAGLLTAETEFSIYRRQKEFGGNISANIIDFTFDNHPYSDIIVEASKERNKVEAYVSSRMDGLEVEAAGEATLAGANSHYILKGVIGNLHLGLLGLRGKMASAKVGAKFDIDITGNNIDNLMGHLIVEKAHFTDPTMKTLNIEKASVTQKADSASIRDFKIETDFFDATMKGRFTPHGILAFVRSLASDAMPSLLGMHEEKEHEEEEIDVTYSAVIKKGNALTDFFKLPVTFVVDVPMKGVISSREKKADFHLAMPYLRQGANKLIRYTYLDITFNGTDKTGKIDIRSLLPTKKSDMNLTLSAIASKNNVSTTAGWKINGSDKFKGEIGLETLVTRNPMAGNSIDIAGKIRPGKFYVNDSVWRISSGPINYSDKHLRISDLRAHHGMQLVEIDGHGSASTADTLMIKLRDIDLGFIFETLAINNVAFAGIATGDIEGVGLFSSQPVALTDNLSVRGLAYNGGVIGDAMIKSLWDNKHKKVGIYADVREKDGHRAALIDGGIWVARDSLDFNFYTDKVNIKFLQPFMSAFCDEVAGRASGHARLFGTFKDMNLEGNVRADTIAMKLGITNVTYYAYGDSVFIEPGKIHIPEVTLYDRFGHTAKFSGELTHDYFHLPKFNFIVRDAEDLLVYDTNERLNPDWYGTVFGTGSGQIIGYPGTVNVNMNMSTGANSIFTFVLNDTETAEDYRFLTFTDRRREQYEREHPDTVPDFVRELEAARHIVQDTPSIYNIDLRIAVTPEAQLILVMDPVGGDKIRSKGSGALQMIYSSRDNELAMYGKYTLDEGSYNFTLQDIIIKDFTIREGSSIAFNGDPYRAVLDIDAFYRINTNLTDLDKSFAADRDLNRTNVPVDAVMKVTGDLDAPDINFDIELPTLTQDVMRKVKSIISTDDMMNRQILYLLALSRFYTPEYMSGGNSGSELASVVSSTMSSHLANILGQLSDNWSIAPSFRTDKGNFSDMEVDVALSSRLLNNRLLINGNLGYRDKRTSNTTFVGDFDIEYLLTPRGNLRLKAYNHYNDQNYYLKSALTTQGIGIVWRHDFDDAFSWLRKKKKKKPEKEKPRKDVVKPENEELLKLE